MIWRKVFLKNIHFGRMVVGVIQMIIHFSKTSIPPSVHSSIYPFLQIILMLNLYSPKQQRWTLPSLLVWSCTCCTRSSSICWVQSWQVPASTSPPQGRQARAVMWLPPSLGSAHRRHEQRKCFVCLNTACLNKWFWIVECSTVGVQRATVSESGVRIPPVKDFTEQCNFCVHT